mgnify:CR=1 FL=1
MHQSPSIQRPSVPPATPSGFQPVTGADSSIHAIPLRNHHSRSMVDAPDDSLVIDLLVVYTDRADELATAKYTR